MESESQVSGDGRPRLPRRREPNLAGLATFTLDSAGRVATWSLTATRVFGHSVGTVAGRHVCDVLLTSPGQRQLADQALAEVAAGRVWTATLPLASGPIALRCEPLVGAGPGALVIAQVAAQQPDPGWLSEAAARIGTTLDLSTTANEAVDVAVPGFADASSHLRGRAAAGGRRVRLAAAPGTGRYSGGWRRACPGNPRRSPRACCGPARSWSSPRARRPTGP